MSNSSTTRVRKEKTAEGKLDFGFDWSDWLYEGDTLAASAWEIEVKYGDEDPADLDFVADEGGSAGTHDGTTTTCWVEGGTVGITYRLTNTVTSAEGRSDNRGFDLNIVAERDL